MIESLSEWMEVVNESGCKDSFEKSANSEMSENVFERKEMETELQVSSTVMPGLNSQKMMDRRIIINHAPTIISSFCNSGDFENLIVFGNDIFSSDFCSVATTAPVPMVGAQRFLEAFVWVTQQSPDAIYSLKNINFSQNNTIIYASFISSGTKLCLPNELPLTASFSTQKRNPNEIKLVKQCIRFEKLRIPYFHKAISNWCYISNSNQTHIKAIKINVELIEVTQLNNLQTENRKLFKKQKL